MSTVIIDYRADEAIISKLCSMGFDVVPSFRSKQVSAPLSGHPDLQICKLPENLCVCTPESYAYYSSALKSSQIRLLCGTSELNCNYPFDVAYNVAWIGDFALHNFNYTDKTIVEYLDKFNVSRINVAQGYTKCNVCCVSDNAIITSDSGIIEATSSYDIDVLPVSTGGIDIFNWSYGFIGGASGKLNGNTLAFCGDLTQHPDYKRIISFCAKHNVECISLSDKRLIDLGTVVSL